MTYEIELAWSPRRPARPVSPKLTVTEQRLLDYYRSIGEETFYRSLIRIAADVGVSIKSVQRANDHLRGLGKLSWETGHGNAKAGVRGLPNHYSLTE